MRNINNISYSIVSIKDINNISAENPSDFVEKSEDYYKFQLAQAANIIKNSKGKYRIVLLCGPSSSGKTTTAHKLKNKLVDIGVQTEVISMDNFFIGIKNYPLRPDGKADMESIETLDTKLLNECLNELLIEGKSNFPIFDFKKQERLKDQQQISIGKNEVIIMEGIHALNPLLIKDIPTDKIFRMYVSVRTKFMDKEKEVLRPSEIRLVRRMVRDTLFRGYSVKDTVEYWDHVLCSERKYINPYRDDVDFKMDTTIDYEVCTWHKLLHDTVTAGDLNEFKKYSFMERILDGLLQFNELSTNLIPENSLLREFIG